MAITQFYRNSIDLINVPFIKKCFTFNFKLCSHVNYRNETDQGRNVFPHSLNPESLISRFHPSHKPLFSRSKFCCMCRSRAVTLPHFLLSSGCLTLFQARHFPLTLDRLSHEPTFFCTTSSTWGTSADWENTHPDAWQHSRADQNDRILLTLDLIRTWEHCCQLW